MMLLGVIAKRRVVIPPSWTPASLPGLYAWYQADSASNTQAGANITVLADLSGNGRNATLTNGTPTLMGGGLNGHGYFNVTANSTVYANIASSVGFLNAKPAGNFGAMVVPNDTGTTAHHLLVCDTPSNTFARFYVRYPGPTSQRFSILGRRLDADSLQTLTPTANNTGNTAFIACVDYALALAEMRTNGTSLFSSTFQTAGNTSATDSFATAKLLSTVTGAGFGGSCYEFVLANAAWSLSDRQKLEGYLCWRYGTQADLPSGHPYKSAPP